MFVIVKMKIKGPLKIRQTWEFVGFSKQQQLSLGSCTYIIVQSQESHMHTSISKAILPVIFKLWFSVLHFDTHPLITFIHYVILGLRPILYEWDLVAHIPFRVTYFTYCVPRQLHPDDIHSFSNIKWQKNASVKWLLTGINLFTQALLQFT